MKNEGNDYLLIWYLHVGIMAKGFESRLHRCNSPIGPTNTTPIFYCEGGGGGVGVVLIYSPLPKPHYIMLAMHSHTHNLQNLIFHVYIRTEREIMQPGIKNVILT